VSNLAHYRCPGCVTVDGSEGGIRSALISSPAWCVARICSGFTAQGLGDESAIRGIRLAEDVPVLRTNHVTIQAILFGVREVAARSSPLSVEQVKEINMLWTIFVILLVLWLLGFSLHIAGGLIHLLLVVALVVLVINLVSGRRVV
jgi:hypothetical protein